MLEYMLDQSDLLEYTTASGLPQESKLVTYMNHSATPSHEPSDLNESLNKLTMDSAQANEASGSQYRQPHPASGSQYQQQAQASGSQYHQPHPASGSQYQQQAQASGSQYRQPHPASGSQYQHQAQASGSQYQHQAQASGSQYRQPHPASGSQYQHQAQASGSQYRQPHPNYYLAGPSRMLLEFLPMNYFNHPPPPVSAPPVSPHHSLPLNSQIHQENVGGTTYFYPATNESRSASVAMSQPPPMGAAACLAANSFSSNMFNVPPPPIQRPTPASLSANEGTDGDEEHSLITPRFPDRICTEVHRKPDQSQEMHLCHLPNNFLDDLPETVEMFTSLKHLEASATMAKASSFLATDRFTGENVALRRLHGCGHLPTTNDCIDTWMSINHPNLVRLRGVIPTKDFGDNSMLLIYDYHPMMATVATEYLSITGLGSCVKTDAFSDPDVPRPYTHYKNALLRAAANSALLKEEKLWSLLAQIACGLYEIHRKGLACRTLIPSKVIFHERRARISWCGYADVLCPSKTDITIAQQEDMLSLGRLMLSVACRTTHCENTSACLDLISAHYSEHFRNIMRYLLNTPTDQLNIFTLSQYLGTHALVEVEALERRSDELEEQLLKEIDNGRLLRIMIKLNVINERPEVNRDSSWAETGDRYMLKLFRDHVFHSTTADGRPWIDQAHVTNALNLLDAGSTLKVSRWQQQREPGGAVAHSARVRGAR